MTYIQFCRDIKFRYREYFSMRIHFVWSQVWRILQVRICIFIYGIYETSLNISQLILVSRYWRHSKWPKRRNTATQWASYHIRKIVGCACAGKAGNFFPRHRLQRKPLLCDPGVHHGTCATHVPWCMSGSLTRGGGKRSQHSRRMRNTQYCVSGQKSMYQIQNDVTNYCPLHPGLEIYASVAIIFKLVCILHI